MHARTTDKSPLASRAKNVTKGEIAQNKQFLLLPQLFQLFSVIKPTFIELFRVFANIWCIHADLEQSEKPLTQKKIANLPADTIFISFPADRIFYLEIFPNQTSLIRHINGMIKKHISHGHVMLPLKACKHFEYHYSLNLSKLKHNFSQHLKL